MVLTAKPVAVAEGLAGRDVVSAVGNVCEPQVSITSGGSITRIDNTGSGAENQDVSTSWRVLAGANNTS